MPASVMSHSFAQVPSVGIQRSSFSRNHGLKTTFDAGWLIPIFWDEVLPGDTHNVRMQAFGRLATPIHPVMDNMFLDTFFFFVPNRLVWDKWERFCGMQVDPGDSTDYTVPKVTVPSGGFPEGTIYDYFGVPTKVDSAAISPVALYFRGYHLIWNEWFRDQNLQDSVTVQREQDGPDQDTLYTLQRRGKRHDYFTSCLPWPQKTGTEVLLPLGTSADIDYVSGSPAVIRFGSSGALATGVTGFQSDGTTAQWENQSGTGVLLDPNGSLVADLSTATASTINDLRNAFQVQRMYEKDARGGTRYVEIIKNHFRVVSPDFRHQRPEYLGGGSTPINIHPVTQTSETGTQPQGSMAGFGTVGVSGHGFAKSFTEHGFIIGLASVRADLTYQQGLDRHFSRSTRFDYYWPGLANLGEQSVLNKEIYSAADSQDDNVFGYQERYAEYRYKPSRVTGQFRSNHTTSLDPWHLSIDFSARPVLNASFIEDNPPIDRVIQTPTEPHIILDAYFVQRSARPMPVHGVPGMIDHF